MMEWEHQTSSFGQPSFGATGNNSGFGWSSNTAVADATTTATTSSGFLATQPSPWTFSAPTTTSFAPSSSFVPSVPTMTMSGYLSQWGGSVSHSTHSNIVQNDVETDDTPMRGGRGAKQNRSSKQQHPKKSKSNQEKNDTLEPEWDKNALAGLLHDADVLLGPRFHSFESSSSSSAYCISRMMRKGTSAYYKLLDTYRPAFDEQRKQFKSRSSTEEQLRLIRALVESVWAQDGRFLIFDETTGILRMVPNDDVLKQVRRDLLIPPKRNSVNKLSASKSKKSISSSSSMAKKKKLKPLNSTKMEVCKKSSKMKKRLTKKKPKAAPVTTKSLEKKNTKKAPSPKKSDGRDAQPKKINS